jgi:lysophospholipase L1-like esterase
MSLLTLFNRPLRGRIKYLLGPFFRPNITPGQSAPLTSPFTEPGAADSITITDTGNKVSIVNNALRFASITTTADPMAAGTTALQRVPGRAFYTKYSAAALVSFVLGWSTGNTPAAGSLPTFTGIQFRNDGTMRVQGTATTCVINDTWAASTQYELLMLLTGFGGQLFIRGGAYSQWTRLYVNRFATSSSEAYKYLAPVSRYPRANSIAGASAVSLTNYSTFPLGRPWNQLSAATATAYKEASSASDTLTADADAIIEHTVTAATGVTQELLVRRTDDSNCWIVRMDQAAGKVYLYQKQAGVETEVGATGGIAQTWTNATDYRVVARCTGASIEVFVNDTVKQITTSATFNQTATGVKVSHAGKFLAAWSRTVSSINLLSRAGYHSYVSYGDSKTYGQGDTTTVGLGYDGYPPLLSETLNAATGDTWQELWRIGHSGYTTANMLAVLTSDLAAAPAVDALGNQPRYVLVNATINDPSTSVDQATYESNLGQILDALHTKWSDARILVARYWSNTRTSGQLALFNDTYIPNVLASRPWAAVGMDERTFLPGADNGATNTADGVHPNRTGYILTAAAWQTSMGY